jgi:MOSC domain-containing protein YiiM
MAVSGNSSAAAPVTVSPASPGLLAHVTIDGVFSGRVAPLMSDGRVAPSAIVKTARRGRIRIETDGIVGDEQADRHAHGGAEKALHHWPAEHYTTLASAFSDAQHLYPGALGENFSTRGLTEGDVCIGDIFALGTARIQIAQPRTPCWKIDSRCGAEGMASYIGEHGMAGWYYRVLEPGDVDIDEAGDIGIHGSGASLIHLERLNEGATLARFWRTIGALRPSMAALHALASLRGLNPDWQRKLHTRIDWLKNNAT